MLLLSPLPPSLRSFIRATSIMSPMKRVTVIFLAHRVDSTERDSFPHTAQVPKKSFANISPKAILHLTITSTYVDLSCRSPGRGEVPLSPDTLLPLSLSSSLLKVLRDLAIVVPHSIHSIHPSFLVRQSLSACCVSSFRSIVTHIHPLHSRPSCPSVRFLFVMRGNARRR